MEGGYDLGPYSCPNPTQSPLCTHPNETKIHKGSLKHALNWILDVTMPKQLVLDVPAVDVTTTLTLFFVQIVILRLVTGLWLALGY